MIQTFCPACATMFRVTPEQLKAKQGRVRCGKCQHVFNALETLHEVAIERAPVAREDSQPELEMMVVPVADQPVADPHVADLRTEAPVEETPVEADEPQLPNQLFQAPVAPRRLVWPWAVASIFALLVLLIQLTIHYRVELSVLLPDAKPLLRALCSPFGCNLPLPQLADLLSIESDDLHPDTRQSDRLILRATLKNRAPFVQAYPHLELTLTDTVDKAVLRRVLTPAEYLAKDVKIARGFAANGELAVDLALVYDNAEIAPATGYRLYLFYP